MNVTECCKAQPRWDRVSDVWYCGKCCLVVTAHSVIAPRYLRWVNWRVLTTFQLVAILMNLLIALWPPHRWFDLLNAGLAVLLVWQIKSYGWKNFKQELRTSRLHELGVRWLR